MIWVYRMKIRKFENNFKPHEYAYLDGMPFEGWLWEIIRRSREYQTKFDEYVKELNKWIHSGLFDKNKKKFTQTERKNIENQLALLHRMMDEVEAKIGVADEAFMTSQPGLGKKILDLFDHYAFTVIPTRFPAKEYLQIAKKKNLIKSYSKNITTLGKMIAWGRGIPVPQIKYYQFAKTLYPVIRTDFMRCYTFDQINKDIDHPIFGKIDLTPLDMLSPTKPEDTVYIGISKKTNIKDLEKILIPEIKKHLVAAKSRIRVDKWKYYLIVYDMKQEGLSYSEISELMYQAYACDDKANSKLTDNAFDVRTIENYHKNALALLAGGFKKYMQVSK